MLKVFLERENLYTVGLIIISSWYNSESSLLPKLKILDPYHHELIITYFQASVIGSNSLNYEHHNEIGHHNRKSVGPVHELEIKAIIK